MTVKGIEIKGAMFREPLFIFASFPPDILMTSSFILKGSASRNLNIVEFDIQWPCASYPVGTRTGRMQERGGIGVKLILSPSSA